MCAMKTLLGMHDYRLFTALLAVLCLIGGKGLHFQAPQGASACLKYGIGVPPTRANEPFLSKHARGCQHSCAKTKDCIEFYFWESGLCSFQIASRSESDASQRRRLLPSDAADKYLSKVDFEALPNVIRGNVNFEMLRLCYETMQAIWEEHPLKPIYSTDLAKWGAVYPGRVEGRVIASLKSLELINVKRDGGIMLRKFPGAAAVKPQAVLPSNAVKRWSQESDDDRRRSDGLAVLASDKTERYVSGPPACAHHHELPVVFVAPFLNGLIKVKTAEGEKARDDEAWEEHRSPVAEKCLYRDASGDVGAEILYSIDSPRRCQGECAARSSCAFFSFSGSQQTCRFHGVHAEKATETSDYDWCGPSPRCPYRHWLKPAKAPDNEVPDKTVCTYSSWQQSSYPWPWFNEFALEATMLRRWRADLLTCRPMSTKPASAQSSDDCGTIADVVVVPSLYLHSTGFRSVNPWDAADGEEKFLSDIEREKRHRTFWDKIRRAFVRNSTVVGKESWPLIVVHYSYVFDATWNIGMLHSLMQQPAGFQERVVIGAIESNMHEDEVQLMPAGWSSNGFNVMRRSHGLGFRIVTLPYPVSVTEAREYHARNDSADPRPILALFSGSLSRGRQSNTGRQGQANRLRGLVVKAMQRQGGICTADACGICAVGQEAACEALVLHQNAERIWMLAANSVFCLEPPGDTLTRSHLYISVLSGCIPVIFDGGDGSDLYASSRPTYWPWRLVPEDMVPRHGHMRQAALASALNARAGLDYASFTVIVNSSEVLGFSNALDGDYMSFMTRLVAMPTDEPDKLASLQRGVDAAAPAFVYAPSRTRPVPSQHDAFSRFFSLVTSPLLLRDEPRHLDGSHRRRYAHRHGDFDHGPGSEHTRDFIEQA